MERVSEEKNHNKTSQSPTSQQLKSHNYDEFTAGEWSGAINIPLDLRVEILKKLPVKSLLRFRCVSKQWSTIISSRRDFIDSIVTRSLAQPQRDYHFIPQNCVSSSCEPFFIFSSTYPHKISRSVPIIETKTSNKELQYVRGLIGYWSLYFGQFTIHSPTTRQSLSLPDIPCPLVQRGHYIFGYDPCENQYKVVCLQEGMERSCQVFTLGDPTKQWRNIQCSIDHHFALLSAVCINGAIYYKARNRNDRSHVLVSFDVKSEKFNHVQIPQMLKDHLRDWTLVNYQGKLGCSCQNPNKDVAIWVMEDAKKQEWLNFKLFSKHHFSLLGLINDTRFPGVTPGGEIVIVNRPSIRVRDTPLTVYYYDPKQISFRNVEIEITALGNKKPSDPLQIWAVPVHVENTMSF